MTTVVYLIDTDVLSELRKRGRANPGVLRFFEGALNEEARCYVSVITIGELRRGVDLVRHRGDEPKARLLEAWLRTVLDEYGEYVLDLDRHAAEFWGRLRVPAQENAIDKLIAATALIGGLTVVTRNVKRYRATGVAVLDPFS